MSVNSKMTAIADEIRTLTGVTGTMGLDDMATHVGEANSEVSSQTDLIAQISAALEGKAGGGSSGGSSGGAALETCTVDISVSVPAFISVTSLNADSGMPYSSCAVFGEPFQSSIPDVLVNTNIVIATQTWPSAAHIDGDIERGTVYECSTCGEFVLFVYDIYGSGSITLS